MSNVAPTAPLVTTPGEDRKEFEAGPDLYREVLSAFVRRRERPRSLNEWCSDQDPVVPRSTANAALHGQVDSEDARALRRRILVAAGLISSGEKE